MFFFRLTRVKGQGDLSGRQEAAQQIDEGKLLRNGRFGHGKTFVEHRFMAEKKFRAKGREKAHGFCSLRSPLTHDAIPIQIPHTGISRLTTLHGRGAVRTRLGATDGAVVVVAAQGVGGPAGGRDWVHPKLFDRPGKTKKLK